MAHAQRGHGAEDSAGGVGRVAAEAVDLQFVANLSNAAIGRGRDFFTINWWAVTFPGLAIFATVLGLSLVGDGLQDAFNPRLRGR